MIEIKDALVLTFEGNKTFTDNGGKEVKFSQIQARVGDAILRLSTDVSLDFAPVKDKLVDLQVELRSGNNQTPKLKVVGFRPRK